MSARDSVVFFGTYDTRLHPRVAVMRDGLAGHGWKVEELNAPLGASTADKVAAAGSIGSAVGLLWLTLRRWVALIRRRRRIGAPDVVVVGYMGHLDVHLARALFPRSQIVLDHLVGMSDTLADRGLSTGFKSWLLRIVDNAALRAADLILVDTEAQAAMLDGRHRGRAVVVPVGATDEWAAAADRRHPVEDGDEDSPLKVVFFGLFTPLQGTPTIGAAIAALASENIDFTMVGHGQDLAETRRLAAESERVTWLDWVDPQHLADLVANHDVCLGIFGTGPKASRVVPTKVYQGLASGCAVVTADTPPARLGLGDDVLLVPPGDPAALADQLVHLNSDRTTLHRMRQRAAERSRRFQPMPATEAMDRRLREHDDVPAARLPPLTMNAWLRWDVIERRLPAAQAGDILEIGSGEGAVACRLARRGHYTAVESSPRTRDITRRRLEAQHTPGRVLAGLDQLDPGERFDVVCAFEVLEHIEDDEQALKEWISWMRPGGTLLLSIPAGPHRMAAADRIAGHFRRYSPAGIAALATGAGATDVEVRQIGFPMGYALEAVRNLTATRSLARMEQGPVATEAQLTEASSSFLQPPWWASGVTRFASAPGRIMQRRFPGRGPGLVLSASKAR